MKNIFASVADLFKKPDLNFVEAEDDFVAPRTNAGTLPFNRFAQILPYTAFDEDHNLFIIESDKPGKIEGYGFVIEVSPQLGADQQMADYLSEIFALGTSEGIGFQIQIFGSPNLDNFLKRMGDITLKPEDVPAERREQCEMLNMMNEQRQRFYKTGATHDLYANVNTRMREFRCNISVVIPASNYNQEAPKREAVSVRQQMMTILQQFYLFEYVWSPDDLINYLSMVLNPQRTLNYEYSSLNYDDTREIRDQIVAPDTKAVEHDEHIVYTSGQLEPVVLKAMSVRSYPTQYTLNSASELLGSSTSSAIAYPCPFLITMGVRVPNYESEKSKTTIKAARAQQTAESQMGKLLPHLQEVNQDWKILQHSFDEGIGVCKMTMQLILMCHEKDAERCEQAAKGVWRAERFELTTDRKMQKQGLLASLPMLMGPLMQKDLQIAQRITTKTAINAANMMPIIGEWRGTPARPQERYQRPVLTFFGRKGQAMGIDLFANPSGNYNGAIVGTSGAGKSFLVNELVRRTLATGGRTWILDVGRSYKKSCDLLKGQYIEIGTEADDDPETRITFNPFLLVNDLKEDMEMIKPLLAQMISPSRPLTDYESAQLELHIQSVWLDRDVSGVIPDVTLLAESLKNNCSNGGPNARAGTPEYEEELRDMNVDERAKLCDPRIRDLGVQLFPFTREGTYGQYFHEGRLVDFKSNFIVLELEQLNAKPDLRAVVMFLLMYRITQDMYLSDRNTNKVVVIDEAWDLMSHGNSGQFIEAGYRRARKYGGAFITATQSIGDYSASPTSQAALDNADWLFLMRQKKESIEALEKSGKFIMDAQLKEMLKSVKTIHGAYAEVLIRGGEMPPSIGRLFTDPYTTLLSSTSAGDYTAVDKYVKQGKSMHEALLQVLEDRDQSLVH